MRLLLFLQRFTFICNLLFLLCLVILYTDSFITNKDMQNFIIILGWFVSLIMNIVVNVWEMILLASRKPSIVPAWLRIFNMLMLCVQVLFFSL